jgi:aryl-alcohol dehydrogenase-like predicted oxidoreductase
MFPAVTCAIPGGKTPQQVEQNVAAGELPPLDEATMRAVQAVYNEQIRPQVHALW